MNNSRLTEKIMKILGTGVNTLNTNHNYTINDTQYVVTEEELDYYLHYGTSLYKIISHDDDCVEYVNVDLWFKITAYTYSYTIVAIRDIDMFVDKLDTHIDNFKKAINMNETVLDIIKHGRK